MFMAGHLRPICDRFVIFERTLKMVPVNGGRLPFADNAKALDRVTATKGWS